MKILVSGGCGQIGSRTTEMLLERGDEVLAVDNFATGRRIHLPESHPGLTFVEGSIADKELVDKLTAEFKPDAMVHTAASYKDPDGLVQRYPHELRRRGQLGPSLPGKRRFAFHLFP